MEPRVSFVIPCYNYGRFLTQALDSLLDQTFQALEIIVIDDASTDETAEVLDRYKTEPRVRIVRHKENERHIRSYNEGLRLARGQFVGILSADDYCLSRDAIMRQVTTFDENPRVGMVYAAYALVRNGHVVDSMVPWPNDFVRNGLDEFRCLMWGNYVLHSGTLLRREVQAALGFYDATLPQSADLDMWLRAATRVDVGYIAEQLYAYRLHVQNMQHKGIPPWQQTEQNLRALMRGFAVLPDDAPGDIRDARNAVLRHALLQTAWFDLFNGRRSRSWQGLAYALKRQPWFVLSGECWRFTARLILMTGMGQNGYRQTLDRLQRLRGYT